jgi:hypothetical protein
MYKVMSAFALHQGIDPEEFWKYHTQIHAEDVKKAAGPVLKRLKRYAINRVARVWDGEPKFFGIVEMWWEDAEGMRDYYRTAKSYKTASGKNPMQDFMSRVDTIWSIEIEEANISLPE